MALPSIHPPCNLPTFLSLLLRSPIRLHPDLPDENIGALIRDAQVRLLGLGPRVLAGGCRAVCRELITGCHVGPMGIFTWGADGRDNCSHSDVQGSGTTNLEVEVEPGAWSNSINIYSYDGRERKRSHAQR